MKKILIILFLLLLVVFIVLLIKRVNNLNKECQEYANSNWIVTENIHAENLKERKIVFCNLKLMEPEKEIDGWTISSWVLTIDEFRKKKGSHKSYAGIDHFIYCNYCINLNFACSLFLEGKIAIVKEMVNYLERYDTEGLYYKNTLSALKTFDKSNDLINDAAGNYKTEFEYFFKQ